MNIIRARKIPKLVFREMVYYESFKNKTDARREELFLKIRQGQRKDTISIAKYNK